MKENYITLETAKLALSKKFNIACWGYYDSNNKLSEAKYSKVDNRYGTEIPAPTQSLLQKWLGEVHEIHVTPRESYAFDRTLEYVCTVNDVYVSHNNPKPQLIDFQLGNKL
jgi:hypothetical protein